MNLQGILQKKWRNWSHRKRALVFPYICILPFSVPHHALGICPHPRGVFKSVAECMHPLFSASLTVFLTLPKKKSSSILSQKMALDMANRMQVVWNTSTFHRGCDKQNTAYYVLARLWKGAVPMARPQSGSKLSSDYTSAIWCNKG